MLLNNLTGNGRQLAFIHYTEIVCIKDSSILESAKQPICLKLADTLGAQFRSLRFVKAPNEMLLAASDRAINFYSTEPFTLLHSVPLENLLQTNTKFGFLQGLSALCFEDASKDSIVFAGTSDGSIVQIPVKADDFGSVKVVPNVFSGYVLDLDCHPNNGSHVLVASGSLDVPGSACGIVKIFTVDWTGCIDTQHTIKLDSEGLCTCVRVRDVMLFCACSNGALRVFHLETAAAIATISAHARCINAMEIHPVKSIIATASEDSTIGVFNFSESGSISHVAYIESQDSLLTGLAYCGGTPRDFLAASAYDEELIQAWTVVE